MSHLWVRCRLKRYRQENGDSESKNFWMNHIWYSYIYTSPRTWQEVLPNHSKSQNDCEMHKKKLRKKIKASCCAYRRTTFQAEDQRSINHHGTSSEVIFSNWFIIDYIFLDHGMGAPSPSRSIHHDDRSTSSYGWCQCYNFFSFFLLFESQD